jgi:acetone carboxylase gamma subunit
VITAVDDRLRDEARRFALRFACPDCASFDDEARRCSLTFPVDAHIDPDLEGRSEVVFCKAFELR